MSDLAVILVHYRTPALLLEAVRALRNDLDSADLEAEIVVVDNGSDAADRDLWRDLPLRWIDPGRNLGYAGGVRCGVEATSAARIVAMNPDVLVVEGCLGGLLRELDRGAAAAGPQFFWDRERRLLLPPTEPRSALSEIRAALARRFPAAGAISRSARRGWRRHAHRHWEASGPLASPALSGALLAFRRDVWTKIGPFDDVFPLYFEETDWLLRAELAGFESRFVPGAHAIHLFAQSSVQEPRATAWFAEAERLFRRRHFSAGVAGLLERLSARSPRARRAPARECAASPLLAWSEIGLPGGPAWIEIALSEGGFPAAGERVAMSQGDWQMPAELWRQLPTAELWIRGVDATGRESAPMHLRRTVQSEAV